MQKRCSPLISVLYTTAHFLQLRQWCSTVAYQANADSCNVSPLLDPAVHGSDAEVSSGAATAGGTVAPYLQLGTQMTSPHLVSGIIEALPSVWGNGSTFDGMAGEAPDD